MKDKVSDHIVNGLIRDLKTYLAFLIHQELWNKGNPIGKISFTKQKRNQIFPVYGTIGANMESQDKDTHAGYRSYCMISVFGDRLTKLPEWMNPGVVGLKKMLRVCNRYWVFTLKDSI